LQSKSENQRSFHFSYLALKKKEDELNQREAQLAKREKEVELREAQFQLHHHQQQAITTPLQPTTPKTTPENEMLISPQDYPSGISWKQPARPMNRMNSMPNIGGLQLAGHPSKENGFYS